jgi:hypothetical protein
MEPQISQINFYFKVYFIAINKSKKSCDLNGSRGEEGLVIDMSTEEVIYTVVGWEQLPLADYSSYAGTFRAFVEDAARHIDVPAAPRLSHKYVLILTPPPHSLCSPFCPHLDLFDGMKSQDLI